MKRLLRFVNKGAPAPFMLYCYLTRREPLLSKTMKSFLFINCSNNQRIVVEAANHDEALRAAAKQAGSFFLSFITIL